MRFIARFQPIAPIQDLRHRVGMKAFTVQRGRHISPDVGLSSDFKVATTDDHGCDILLCIEPREWLDEWSSLIAADLPVGSKYERLLTISAWRFRVTITAVNGVRHYRFDVFDVTTRTDRPLTLSDPEARNLVDAFQRELAR